MPSGKKFHPLNSIGLIFFFLNLGFTACTQGQGPTGEAPQGAPKVTLAGADTTPPVDVCENPENLDNILCQWVAQEMEVNDSAGKRTYQMSYDSEARIIQLITVGQGGHHDNITTLTYNDNSLLGWMLYSDADPPESEYYTTVTSGSYFYNDHGLLEKKTSDLKKGGATQTSTRWTFTYPQPNKVENYAITEDGAHTVTGIIYETITKDSASGKLLTDEVKYSTDPRLYGAIDTWAVQTYQYNTQTGRLDKITYQSQDCKTTACVFTSPIVSAVHMETRFSYDGKGRFKGFTAYDSGGIPNKSCETSYEIQTQGKMAGPHPQDFILNVFFPTQFSLDLNDRDIFSTWNCETGGQPSEENKFKWVRLWQALPEGKPPGGS
jgi:hypothetical protein